MTADSGSMRGTSRFALVAVLALALALRIASAKGDLWIDEVWSLYNLDIAHTLSDWQDLLALFFHDNTHPLNTIQLFLIGPDASAPVYRAFSVVCGFAAVALAWAVGRRSGDAVGLVAALLLALSFAMINYSGEARGYAAMAAASLGAYLIAELWLEKPTQGRAALFVTISLIGLMSHLSFVVVQSAIGLRMLVEIWLRTRSPVTTAAQLVTLFGVQIVYLTAFISIAVNNMIIGGGVTVSPPLVSMSFLILTMFGIDMSDIGTFGRTVEMVPLALNLGLALGLVLVAGLALVAVRGRRNEWIVPAVAVFVFPILLVSLVALSPQVTLAHRYFIAAVPFALLLLAHMAVWGIERGRWWRAATVLAVCLYVLGNANLLRKLYTFERGNYVYVLKEVAASSQGQARITSNNILRGEIMLNYHIPRAGLSEALHVVKREEDKADPAEWFVLINYHNRIPVSSLSRAVGPNPPVAYDLFNTVPHWGMSGDTWAVYRRRK